MSLIILLLFLVLFLVFYSYFISFSFQVFLNKKFLKIKYLKEFIELVKGNFIENGYFKISHHLVDLRHYNSYSIREKVTLTSCYNIVKFKTQDANWELFFYLVKDGLKFREVLSIRCFPKYNHIRSEGNIEKNISRLNIYTNTRKLTDILESQNIRDTLKDLIRNNGDLLLVYNNNLHYKIFLDSKKISLNRLHETVKLINILKNNIYKKDNLAY